MENYWKSTTTFHTNATAGKARKPCVIYVSGSQWKDTDT